MCNASLRCQSSEVEIKKGEFRSLAVGSMEEKRDPIIGAGPLNNVAPSLENRQPNKHYTKSQN